MLRVVAWAPLIGAGLALTVAYFPSLIDLAGIASDHCGDHAGHPLHLCFLHYPPPALLPPVTWFTLGMALIVSHHWWDALRAVRRTHRWANDLAKLSSYDEETGAYVVETDTCFAVTVGLFHRRILFSEGLRRVLSPAQLQAVLSHEQAHRHRFDSLHRLFTQIAMVFYLPSTRRFVLEQIALASEQCCDEAAATTVEDRITVAEAILTVARASRGAEVPAGVLRFGDTRIEQRIQALLDGNWQRPGLWGLGALLAIFILTLFHFHTLHHGLEHAVAWLT